VGEEIRSLYRLPLNSLNFNSSSSKFNNAVTGLAFTSFFVESINTSLWHFRLGHLSNFPLKMLSPIIPQLLHKSNKHCCICPLVK
jgi:hypothetical protein